jgi:hypothetical protein
MKLTTAIPGLPDTEADALALALRVLSPELLQNMGLSAKQAEDALSGARRLREKIAAARLAEGLPPNETVLSSKVSGQLLAAAPELLEVVRQFVNETDPEREGLRELHRVAKDVIAKATGGQDVGNG